MMRGKARYDSEVVLGEKYRDDVSGYEGVATATCFFLHGCERVTLEQWNAKKAEFRELTFDSPRLTHIETAKTVQSVKTGGVRPGVPRTGVNR